jgi:peptide/nickel transport system permease protein
VRGVVVSAAANTAVLAVVALVAATVGGIPLGVISGSRRGVLAGAVRAVSLVCLSVPPLLTSLLLVFVAAVTCWFPAGGTTSVNAADLDWAAWLVDVGTHLPLPVLALALPIAATFERLQAQSMSDACNSRSRWRRSLAGSRRATSCCVTRGACRCGRSAGSTAWRLARCCRDRSSSNS